MSPTPAGPASTQPSSSAESSAPRKRRKRLLAAGAKDDCFTCATRDVKCDRRRPFCSQCLDDGKECAGYKTQLTWGNGVASRGKLRGLSLPIAGTQKTATALIRPDALHPKKSAHFKSPPPAQISPKRRSAPSDQQHDPAPDPYGGSTTGELPSQPANSHPHVPLPNATQYTAISWNPLAGAALPGRSRSLEEGLGLSYATACPGLATPADNHGPFTTGYHYNAATYTANDRVSPRSYTSSSPDSAYLARVTSNASVGVSSLSGFEASPTFGSTYESDLVSQPSAHLYEGRTDSYFHQTGYAAPLSAQSADFAGDQLVNNEVEEIDRNHLEQYGGGFAHNSMIGFPHLAIHNNISISSFAGMGAIGVTPRMQFLINYYTEVISPVIVAFDGPSNPYRSHILRLAARSETLQHAISALAASNLRQRIESGALSTGKTDPARRSSMAHLTLTNEPWHNLSLLSPEDQAREESLHKLIAVQSLNRQLADPVLRNDDSVLATLLVLCLFHMCDSGIAKFQTQFAGVKKLLSLRRNHPMFDTREAKWFTRMFTWFDAMTATVNDREGLLQGYHLDVSALSDEEWALENLAGCDGQLFKTIAKLGRLNILSQGKFVEATPSIVPRPVTRMPFTPVVDSNNLDGNGWMRILEDENLFSVKTAQLDVKTQFWREWREIRTALQTWQLDTSLLDSFGPDAPYLTLDQRVDLANISESFRYSALLYTERLANPSVPSTDAYIRAWVQKCLMYIKAVKSDVYLLWPLFITGSECVDELDREVIRQRCLDIQKDSGFLNNQSCLELLEKVWQRYDDEQKSARAPGRSDPGFGFSAIMKMECNEGEYIVV